MTTRIIAIGNSRGVRLPKALLEETGLTGDVRIVARDGCLVITPVRAPRAGWDTAFADMSQRGDDALLDADAMSPSSWDRSQWRW